MSVFFMFHKLLRCEVFCIVQVGIVVTILVKVVGETRPLR